jgi:hypothetical protein
MTWPTHRAFRLAQGLAVLIAALAAPAARADTATLITSSKDATLIEDPTGSVANGTGFAIFAGRVNVFGMGTIRRGLLKFDISRAVPEGSTINSVSLTLRHVQNNNGTQSVRLHRATVDWGEGPSDSTSGQGAPSMPGDSTWIHTFYPDSFWPTPGGDFDPASSASTSVRGIGFYTWASTPGLVADVQAWLDDPASNFGWMVRGNETVMHTTKKFASREWGIPEERPRLVIDFTPPVTGDLNGDGIVNSLDLGILLASWSIPARAPGCGGAMPCAADLNHNGLVDSIDLGILLANWTL